MGRRTVKLRYKPKSDLLERFLLVTLHNRRIHCSYPSRLNDPWDCQPWFDSSCLRNPDEMAKAIEWFQAFTPAERIDPHENALAELCMRHLPSFTGQVIESVSEMFRSFVRERWRIYCLTALPTSALMWSHYADHHRGICLEFAVNNNALFAHALQVIYRCTYPRWTMHALHERVIEILLTKSDDWAYEQKYRIIGRTRDTTPGRDNAFPVVANDFLSLPVGSLLSVIAGCKADHRTIKAVVKEYMPDLPVKRAVQMRNQYGLYIES